MTSITFYAGIDYHQKEIQLCLMDEKGKVLKNAWWLASIDKDAAWFSWEHGELWGFQPKLLQLPSSRLELAAC